MIRGHGSSNPQIMFIADTPQGEDLRTDYALTGYSGDLIRGYLRDNNIHLDNQWRTCLIKEETKKDTDEKIIAQAIEAYSPILRGEIANLQPNLLVPLGELSFNYLTSLRSIRKFRGSVLPYNGPLLQENQNNPPNLKVLPILGPAILNQEYKLRPIARIDFSKIPRYMGQEPIPDNVYNIWVARNSASLREFINRHYAKAANDPKGFLTFDIETYLQIPICISFCFDGFESVCIPFVDSSIDRDNRTLMMELVAKLLASPIPKVNQNIKYDWKILERWGFHVNNVVGDTMLASSVLYCEFPKSLGFLTSIYTDLPYFKDEGKEFDPEKGKKDRYYLYNAKDSLATSQIWAKQREELKETGTEWVDNQLNNLIPIYMAMENRGIRIDKQRQLQLLNSYQSLYDIQQLKLRKLTGRPYFNPLSPKQCREMIFEELGYSMLSGMKINKDGTPSTEEDSLDILAAYGEAKRAPSTGPPTLVAIIGARKIHKVIEILELHLHPDERFRCEFNLAGTENGRTSAGETTDQFIYLDGTSVKVTNLGHSLQTIGKHGFAIDGITYGKDLRSMYVPSYGYSFVEIDLSQAEARVDAVLAGNFDILSIFDGPVGIHRLTGSWAYDCDPSEIKKNILVNGVDRYHVAKQIRHSGERNITAKTLRVKMLPELSIGECTRLLKVFHDKQPEIRNVFHKEIIEALNASSHCLVAPNGRRRDFFDRIDKGTYNEGFSFLPQTIVSDQTKFEGIAKTDAFMKDIKGGLLTEQHDGVLYETPKGRELELGFEYKKNVEKKIDFRMCTLSRDFQLLIPAEISVGDNWFEMEEVKG